MGHCVASEDYVTESPRILGAFREFYAPAAGPDDTPPLPDVALVRHHFHT